MERALLVIKLQLPRRRELPRMTFSGSSTIGEKFVARASRNFAVSRELIAFLLPRLSAKKEGRGRAKACRQLVLGPTCATRDPSHAENPL